MGLFSFLNRKQTKAWSDLVILEKEQMSGDFTVITLEKLENSDFDTAFIPGQYVTLEIESGGQALRRSYSICGKTEKGFKIGVKRIDGGVMSSYLHDKAQKGEKIRVHEPEGNFTIEEEHKICAFVAGSGITPVISMLEAHQGKKNFNVFYNTRTINDVVFSDHLTQVKATVYLSQERKEGFKEGRLGYDALMNELKDNLSLLQCDAYLLCGPEAFMAEIERCLLFFGVPEGKIRKEFFVPPSTTDAPVSSDGVVNESTITVMLDGQTTELNVSVKKKTVLEVLEAAKLDPPYSCRGGVCSSCKAKVISGTAKMRQNFTLTDKEVADGYILTCQAEITSPRLSITFDA
jgi:ring-1,2-phenylacetyl-CoA epoxidase subunit PaaE